MDDTSTSYEEEVLQICSEQMWSCDLNHPQKEFSITIGTRMKVTKGSIADLLIFAQRTKARRL